MRFVLLILDGGLSRGWSRERWADAYERMSAWSNDLERRGILRVGEPLRPDTEGTRVRRREDGTPLLTDGPFTETKDVVGGLTLIECASEAEALEIAKACPATAWCPVEVREIGVGPQAGRRREGEVRSCDTSC